MITTVIASFLEEEHIEHIKSVSSELRVLYDPALVPPPRWPGDHIGPEDWRPASEKETEFLAMLGQAEILYDFPRRHLRNLTQVAPRLRWVQGSMAGAGELAQRAGLLDTDVAVTTASGIYSEPLAEFTMLALLSHVKDYGRLRADQSAKYWNERPVDTLDGKTLCIVGLGSIGREIVRRARAFGMRIIGVKRTITAEDRARGEAEELFETDGLKEAFARADYIAATLPNTPETEHLINGEAIASMRPGAYFINVGRGRVVDEAAMIVALREGRLSGAALDVFEVEPLPPESPLWEMENVIVSPHSTDNVPAMINPRQADLFCENLRRYLAGEPLKNELDKKLMY